MALEISALQARAQSLGAQIQIQASTLLAQDPSLDGSAAQQAHNQQSLYRACASVTAFRVRDPDPHAVDAGSVLGLRFEVVRRGRFLRPYYVLLNRPYADARFLRVHRHTVPSCIPLSGLAARHLAPPEKTGRGQDLSRFVRALRRELARYHERMAGIADLRRAAGLGRGESAKGSGFVDISPADAEARQIQLAWADGRTGRVVLDEDGDVVRVVVYGEQGRDRAAERELESKRLEEMALRLAETNAEAGGRREALDEAPSKTAAAETENYARKS